MAADRIRVTWEPPVGDTVEFSDDPDARFFLLDLTGFMSTRVTPVIVRAPAQRGVSATDVSVDGRTLGITLWITSEDQQTIWDAREELATAFAVEPSPTSAPELGWLTVYRSGRPTRRIAALPVDSPQDDWIGETTVSADISLLAPYPYWEALDEESTTLVPAGGTEFPVEFPWELPSNAIQGVVTNAGTINADVIIRIDGEVDTPRIENVTSGRVLELDIELASGEYVLVNTAYGQKSAIAYPGEENVINSINLDFADFWSLQPGPNMIRFTAVSFGADAVATITWRPNWAGI